MPVNRGDHQLGSLLQARQRFIRVQAKVVFEAGVTFPSMLIFAPAQKNFSPLPVITIHLNAVVHAGR
jgi:hypothetical protein